MDRFFITILIVTCVCKIITTLTIEELKPVHYEVNILKTPIKKGEKHSPSSVFMKSKYGQEYECWLPDDDDDDISKKEGMDSDKNIDIKELLKPIQSGSCLLKVQDWWTYELCPGLYIKQFHIEDGHILGPVITLGVYESDYDWTNETNKAEFKEKFKHVIQPYHSQFYVNGTKCDLTGQPRNAEIRMFCEPDSGDYIYRVDEQETCSYIITIHTARICAYPPLKPVPAKKAHTIPCHPVLSEEQYNKYTQKLNEEQMLIDQKRSQWLNNQQERLQVMKKENLQQMEKEKISKSSSELTNVAGVKSDIVPETKVLDKVEESATEKHLDGEEEDVETFLVQEYDREIEKLKSFLSPDKFSMVKKSIQKHFETILHEAQSDQNPELSEEAKKASFQKLTSTLNLLLKKLDQAEKDALEATEDLSKERAILSEPVSDEDSDEIIIESNDVSKIEIKDRDDDLINEGTPRIIEDDHKQASMLDDDELHVRIRRLDRKSPDSNGKLHEMDMAQKKKLEQAVKEKLEKSGLDTGGRKIEVKIITAGFYNNEDGKDFHILSDEETSQMIMALLVGQQEAVQEMERHKNLEDSYQFNWENEEEKDD